jgi:hypothetical protein
MTLFVILLLLLLLAAIIIITHRGRIVLAFSVRQ